VKQTIPFCLVALVAFFMWLLAAMSPARLPQAASGGDFLSVLLGDAKQDLSYAMIHEADSYFHGGIDMECHALHGHDAHEAHDHAAHGHDEHGEHGHGADCSCGRCGHEDEEQRVEGFDPWRWINSRIRAPEVERHLEGDKVVEMMPWFWMAVKSDPHNEEAWSTAWYTAAYLMKDELLALRIAEDGWRQNPKSMELACVLGRAYRAKGTFDQGKSEAMFEEALRIAKSKGELEDQENAAFYSALGYLSEYAAKRKDAEMLRRLLDEARRRGPDHPVARSIKERLSVLH